MCRWVLEGEIDDYYGEFFVSAQSVKAEALWREGYQLQTAMLPSFIPEPLAQRILRTGKSINFLRVCCSDQGWAQAASEAVAAAGASASGGILGYGEIEVLEALVAEAAGRIDKHLIQIMYKRYCSMSFIRDYKYHSIFPVLFCCLFAFTLLLKAQSFC